MSNELDQENPQSGVKFGKYAYVSSLYFVSVGVLYLWAYWASFGVNILEYTGFTDILKTAAYPIASAFIFMVLGVLWGEITVLAHARSERSLDESFVLKFISKHKDALINVYGIGTGLLWVFGPSAKWALLPVLLGIPIYSWLRDTPLLKDVIPHYRTRTAILFLMVLLPLAAYGRGIVKADEIRTGQSYTYAASEIESTKPSNANDESQRLRLLGYAGSFIFFYNPTNEATVIIASDQAKALELKVHMPKEIPSLVSLLLEQFKDKD
ncbi:hypothetical protein EGT07_22985 [Herbaspirillum sp. HC18]|nr:hypothetical protein EGT07_22985 [Herbaspirillum sp. HC18]